MSSSTKRGPAIAMIIAIIGALILATMFPFAVVSTAPKPLSQLELVKISLEEIAPTADPESLDLDSLRILTEDPNGTVFLGGFTGAGSSVGVIFQGGSASVAISSGKDGKFGFGGGGIDGAGYLELEAAPQNKLGFHFCARSQTGVEPSEKWVNAAARSCGTNLD